MHIVFLFGIISFVLGGCDDNAADNACAVVYEHFECEGASQTINQGSTNWVGSWNDMVSSIVVKGNCKLEAWEHSNYGGKKKNFYGVDPKLKDSRFSGWWFITTKTWNDKISSWKCSC